MKNNSTTDSKVAPSKSNNFWSFISKFTVSLGGVGYIKPASATWGSLFVGIILYFTFPHLQICTKITIALITFAIGTILANYIEKTQKTHDPHFVIIDEAVGMMIVCLFLSQVWWHFIIAFILFRIYDIAKLWPASFFDKRQGGFSIMIDDVIMAIPALFIMEVIRLLT